MLTLSNGGITCQPNGGINGGHNGGLVNGGVHTISNGGTCTLPRYFNGHVPRDLADLDVDQVQDCLNIINYELLVLDPF